MVAQKLRPTLIIFTTILILLIVHGQSIGPVPTASAQVQFATRTLTPTSTMVGPSPTPTATLEPPAAGSGRVAVDELAVRSGPTEDFPVIGRLAFGDTITPVAIDVGGVWVAIDWETGQVGWVASNLIEWSPSVDFSTLPFLEATPIPDGFFLTGTPDSSGPTLTPTATITSVPTTIPETDVVAQGEEEAENTPEPTEEVIAAAPVPSVTPGADNDALSPAPVPVEGSAVSLDPRFLTYAALGLGAVTIAILSVLYGQRRSGGRRELARYADGFPIENCPVCREGVLELDEKVNGALGIISVSRSVRCNNCRSLLREIDPGVWRYNIDPYVNPQLAYKYNTQRFTDADLLMLVQEAQQYEPVVEQTLEGNDRASQAEDIVDLLPEIEPLISEIEKAQEEERQRRLQEQQPQADGPPEETKADGDAPEA